MENTTIQMTRTHPAIQQVWQLNIYNVHPYTKVTCNMFCLLSFLPLIQLIWSLRLSQELNINSEYFINTDVHALQTKSITLISKQTALYISHYTVISNFFLCFVDRAPRYIRVMKPYLLHYLSSVYFVNQPLHVSDIFVAHHQEVCPANKLSTKKHNTYKLLYIYSIPPDDGLQICPKHV
jgi:hypothetical protein